VECRARCSVATETRGHGDLSFASQLISSGCWFRTAGVLQLLQPLLWLVVLRAFRFGACTAVRGLLGCCSLCSQATVGSWLRKQWSVAVPLAAGSSLSCRHVRQRTMAVDGACEHV
jgi:hypothetical protein